MVSAITVAGRAVSLVALPGEDSRRGSRDPWFASVEMSIEDAVASSSSVFTGQVQTFEWPGAEQWYGTCELPPLTVAQEARWRAALAQCRGMVNPFLLGDRRHDSPAGVVSSASSHPVCADGNTAMSKTLVTSGWKANTARLLLAGDYLQIGYCLHMVLDDVRSDGGGNATLEVWPSLRESPAAGLPLILNRPRGLFRLATNKRTWSFDATRLSRMSFQVMEYR